MVDVNDLMRIVELLYEGAASGSWTPTLEGLRSLLGADRAGIVVHDMTQFEPLISDFVGVEDGYRQTYAALSTSPDMVAISALAATRSSDTVVTEEFQLDFPETRRTRFYDEWLRPQRALHQLISMGPPWPSGWGGIVMMRSPATGAFPAEAVAAMRILHVHFLKAVQVRRRLAEVELHRAQALQALEHLDQGVLFVDGQARVLHANREAERVLTESDGLRANGFGLACDTTKDSATLRGLVGLASTGAIDGPGGGLAVQRRSGRRPLSILVAPLPRACDVSLAPGATAIVFVKDAERGVASAADHLRESYGLTQAEARVAEALLTHERLADVAASRGVTLATVRTLLQRVFDKTGTHRQADLVRLMLAHRMHEAG